ncbi:MAG: hypothetical protein AAF360_09125 [Pseudomonadota bacterium]
MSRSAGAGVTKLTHAQAMMSKNPTLGRTLPQDEIESLLDLLRRELDDLLAEAMRPSAGSEKQDNAQARTLMPWMPTDADEEL